MAEATTLRHADQVDYRLESQCGCDAHDHAHEHDAQARAGVEGAEQGADDPADANRRVDYRAAGAEVYRLGSGWAEFGEEAGTRLEGAEGLDSMRRVMAGVDPRSGEQLVAPKMAVDPRAKLAARGLVEAVRVVAEAAHAEPGEVLGSERLAQRFARLERGLARDGEAHRAPVTEMEAIAEAAGVDPGVVWQAGELAEARAHADERVRTGNMGYDLVLNMPKSMSAAGALMGSEAAKEFEEIYLDSVRETAEAVEGWVAYGMSGHHGDGQSARRVGSSGFAASMTLHRSARPVEGQVGDPHIHAHVMIPNMVKCEDGQWRTLAAGGRDVHRHVAAAGELAKARMRDRLSRRYGAVWERDERSGEWEIKGFDAELREQFSSRSKQINALVGEDASPAQKQAAGRVLAEAKNPVGEGGEAYAVWRAKAEGAGYDVDALLAQALPGLNPDWVLGGSGDGRHPSVEDIARQVWDPETGVTSKRKVANRAQVTAAVAGALPGGVSGLAELEALTDAVLGAGSAVRLAAVEGSHLSNAERFTSADVVEAERVLASSAERRLGQGAAVVPQAQTTEVLGAFEAERGFSLSAEQRRTAERLLEAGHGLDMVRGVAGAGKTTLMSAVHAGWSAAGLRVEGAAVAAVAADNLQADSGIASATVASWLQRIESGRGLEGVDVLVVDEAAMVDDRSMARLVGEAEITGTKIVGIGDPAQQRAIGVGGGFAAVHALVKGETLRENRRQTDAVDLEAVTLWQEGAQRSALSVWGDRGRVQAAQRTHEAHEAIAGGWWADRQGIGDRFDAVEELLVLAARNSDVDELNHRLRAMARQGGYLEGPDAVFALRGGQRMELAAGDAVRVRRNDYRSRRGQGEDVLNGFRGVVAEVDERRGARVEWRRRGQVHSAWIAPEAIARGDLSHGYAATIAAAQGLTCSRTHVLGNGADGNSLYSAMTRSRQRADLYLASDALNDPDLRQRLSGARSDKERVQLCLNAFAADVATRDDVWVGDELTAAGPRGPAAEPKRPLGVGEALVASRSKAGSTERPGGGRVNPFRGARPPGRGPKRGL